MLTLRAIKQWVIYTKRVCFRELTAINCDKLYREIESTIPLDVVTLKRWLEIYNQDSTQHTFSHPYLQLAHLCMRACMQDKAAEFYLRFLKKRNDKNIEAMYLQTLMLSDTATNASLMTAHARWAKKFNIKPAAVFTHPKPIIKPEKIRVGYLCHFFSNSIGKNCLLPFFARHDPAKFEIICYDDGSTPEEYHALASQWIDTRGLSDKALAERIKQDNIHILQELNGLCYINRFGALAYQPAPIQINWFNHTSTTGLPFVHYVMSDKISIQDNDLPFYAEKVYRTNDFIAAVQFNESLYGALPAEPPCIKNGYITFGYFGASHKFTPTTIQLWSRVLKQLPNAKLLLKCTSFNEPIYRTIFSNHFTAHGVLPEQLLFEEGCEQAQLLKKYHEIDIMMDNATVNGGSTIFEALLQSVPVITLQGDRWPLRSGASVLTTLNHPELIAHSTEEFVEKVVRLANDHTQLRHYRQHLRHDMLQSSLTNMQRYYLNFEEAYLSMYAAWSTS